MLRNTKRGWVISGVLLILCIGIVMFLPYVNPKPVEPKVTYLMPEKTGNKQVSYAPQTYRPETTTVASDTTSTSTAISKRQQLLNERDKLLQEREDIIADTNRKKVETEKLKKKNRLLRQEIKFRAWIVSDIRPKLDELLPDLEFIMADPTYTSDNFREYFPNSEDRVFYGEKIIELNNVINSLVDRLESLDSSIREKYLADHTNLSRLVRTRMGGEL